MVCEYSSFLKEAPTNISQQKYKCGLLVRAKRLHTPGETTLSLGETNEQDIGRNDRNSKLLFLSTL